MDPGAFGFIPILDRKNGYYMQVRGRVRDGVRVGLALGLGLGYLP